MLSETRPAKVGKWTEPALRVLRERYLTRQGGEVVETPEEMCWRVALTIARGEARYGRSEAAVRLVGANVDEEVTADPVRATYLADQQLDGLAHVAHPPLKPRIAGSWLPQTSWNSQLPAIARICQLGRV